MQYDLLTGEQARWLADAVRDLYAEVYAEPPYEEGPEYVARFVDHFAEEVDRPGFALARAAGGELVGVAYGWTMPAGSWFRSATSEPSPEIRAEPKLAVMEWMVRRAHRGAGVGRRLLDLLLTDRPEPWAVLASNPAAPARQLYERMGWRQVGTTKPDMLPAMDLLVLPLTARRAAGAASVDHNID